jgi:hypothetical protein
MTASSKFLFRHCERNEAIHGFASCGMDCSGAQAPRNDDFGNGNANLSRYVARQTISSSRRRKSYFSLLNGHLDYFGWHIFAKQTQAHLVGLIRIKDLQYGLSTVRDIIDFEKHSISIYVASDDVTVLPLSELRRHL